MQRLLLYIMTLLLLSAGSVMAEDDLDVTMRMVTDDNSASDKVVREIRLPDGASDKARDAAAPGLERAKEASEKGRRAADAARERARKGLEQRNQQGQRNGNSSPGGDTRRPGNDAPDRGRERPDRDRPDQPR